MQDANVRVSCLDLQKTSLDEQGDAAKEHVKAKAAKDDENDATDDTFQPQRIKRSRSGKQRKTKAEPEAARNYDESQKACMLIFLLPPIDDVPKDKIY